MRRGGSNSKSLLSRMFDNFDDVKKEVKEPLFPDTVTPVLLNISEEDTINVKMQRKLTQKVQSSDRYEKQLDTRSISEWLSDDMLLKYFPHGLLPKEIHNKSEKTNKTTKTSTALVSGDLLSRRMNKLANLEGRAAGRGKTSNNHFSDADSVDEAHQDEIDELDNDDYTKDHYDSDMEDMEVDDGEAAM